MGRGAGSPHPALQVGLLEALLAPPPPCCSSCVLGPHVQEQGQVGRYEAPVCLLCQGLDLSTARVAT